MDNRVAETLRRLDRHITEQGLDRSAILNPKELADKTSLPVQTVRLLLKGKVPPEEDFNTRVLSRIQTYVARYRAEHGKTEAQLTTDVMEALKISRPWARSLVRGEKIPNPKALHELACYFELVGQETYFTSSAPEALDRVLQPILLRYEAPERDPVEVLMEQFGVKATDMRMHGAGMTNKQLAAFLEGVVKSVIPPQEDRDEH